MSSTETPPTVPGYEIGDLLARGGAGGVYRAKDSAIGHEVAIKLLFPGATPVVRRRFLDGARIMASLQHPGIPPVHLVGETPDGRPFMVMKLLKGRSLADILLEDRESPSFDLARLLHVFEQVCQTIAYAHCRRVVHRDIKPHNVMIGAFGEVQVVDWGLAKVLGETQSPPLRSEDAPPRGSAHQTQAGSVLGTPAYMPRELAIGAVHQVDERSDVFGLGGILCDILTGGPPFRGENAAEVLRMAADGNPADAFARLDSCGAGAELIDLCKRCLSPEPADRPPHAGVVAGAVSAYRIAAQDRQRGEAVTAGIASERRKRRLLQIALALTVALLLIALGLWWNAVASK